MAIAAVANERNNEKSGWKQRLGRFMFYCSMGIPTVFSPISSPGTRRSACCTYSHAYSTK